MTTHRRYSALCRLVNSSNDKSEVPGRIQSSMVDPDAGNEPLNEDANPPECSVAYEIGFQNYQDDDLNSGVDMDIFSAEPCDRRGELTPIPVLPALDMHLTARERACARFKALVAMRDKDSLEKVTVLGANGSTLVEDDMDRGMEAVADEEDRDAIVPNLELGQNPPSDSASNSENTAPIQPGSPIHGQKDSDPQQASDNRDRLSYTEAVRSALVNLFCPSDGSAGLTHSQRTKTLELVELSLRAGGDLCNIHEVVHTTSSNSKNVEALFFDHIKSLTVGDGWTSQTFEVSGGTAIARWNSKAIDAISDTVARVYEHLIRRPTWDGKHYGHPCSGRFMKDFYGLIRSQRKFAKDWNKDEDFPLLLTYFSDATLLANRGSLSAHPVVVGIANLPVELYASNLITVGYLDSSIQYTAGTSPEVKRQIKRSLVGLQVSAMMEQFVKASYEGCVIDVPPTAGPGCSEGSRRYFPGLFDAALDYPELVSILGIKSGCCGICCWKTEIGCGPDFKEADFRNGIEVRRSEKRSREWFEEMRQAKKKGPVKNLVHKYGAHPQRPSALWGFNGSCPIHCIPEFVPSRLRVTLENWAIFEGATKRGIDRRSLDIHSVVSQETMHEIDLGLTCYLREAVFELMKDSGMTLKMIEAAVNQPLLRTMAHESRWQGLFHPPLTRETADVIGYFGGCSKVQASEHRSVLQAMVPVLCRTLGRDHEATRLAALYLKYYTTRECRLKANNSHTDESLEETDRLFFKFHKRLLDLQPGGKASYNQPKAHAQLHFAERVRRAGHSYITTGEAGESQNAKVKAPYKGGRTNKQTSQVASQLVRHRRQAEAAQKLSREATKTVVLPHIGSSAGGVDKYQTSFVIAARTDSVAFTKYSNVRGRDSFDTDQVQNFVDCCSSGLEPGAPGSKTFETLNKQHQHFMSIFGSPVIAERFLAEIVWWATNERDYRDVLDPVTLNLRLKIVRNAVSASVWPGEERVSSRHRILQRLRCNSNFRSRDVDDRAIMWNDFVAIRGQFEHMGEHTWYARLVLMFHLQCPNSGEWLQYAFVRYLTRLETKDKEQSRLSKSDDEPQVTYLKYTTRRSNNKEVWYYGILLVECIERKVHVIAGNDEASQSLRYSRGEPEYWHDDKSAKFLLNHYIWQSQSSHQYTLNDGTQ